MSLAPSLPPIRVKDQWLHIESVRYRKGDPLPDIDFSAVLELGVSPTEPLVNLARQVEGLTGEEGPLFYYTVRSEMVDLDVGWFVEERKRLLAEIEELRERIEIMQQSANASAEAPCRCKGSPMSGPSKTTNNFPVLNRETIKALFPETQWHPIYEGPSIPLQVSRIVFREDGTAVAETIVPEARP